jgi:excisionase family DNA binding protein
MKGSQQAVFMGMGDVARRLGLSVSRANTLAREGRIPTIRHGRAVRVPAGAFDAWVAAQERAALEALRPGERAAARQ